MSGPYCSTASDITRFSSGSKTSCGLSGRSAAVTGSAPRCLIAWYNSGNTGPYCHASTRPRTNGRPWMPSIHPWARYTILSNFIGVTVKPCAPAFVRM